MSETLHTDVALHYWQEQEAVHLAAATDIEKLMQELPGYREIFPQSQRGLIKCIDERLMAVEGYGLGGAGVLLSNPEKELARIAQEFGTVEFASHDGCGAAAMAKVDPEQTVRGYVQDINEHKDPNAPDLVYAGHLPVEPKNQHIATCLYYVGSDTFTPGRIMQHGKPSPLPIGFISSRRLFHDAEYSMTEAGVCVDIAFGAHGLSSLFNAQRPLVLIAIGHPTNPEYSVGKLQAELQGVRAKYPDLPIKVTGMVAPMAA